MMTLQELKRDRRLLGRIDWSMTPQEAYETFQIKAAGAWRNRGSQPAVYFCIDVWAGEQRLLLIERSMLDSQELAVLPAPPELIAACLESQAGPNPSKGKYPLCPAVEDWIRAELAI